MNSSNISKIDSCVAYDCLRKAINETMKAQSYIIDHNLGSQCDRLSFLRDELSVVRDMLGTEIIKRNIDE